MSSAEPQGSSPRPDVMAGTGNAEPQRSSLHTDAIDPAFVAVLALGALALVAIFSVYLR